MSYNIKLKVIVVNHRDQIEEFGLLNILEKKVNEFIAGHEVVSISHSHTRATFDSPEASAFILYKAVD